MGSGVQRTMYGTFMGTGAQIDLRTVGFRVRKVKLINRTTNITLEWSEGMPDDGGSKQIANGTRTFITTGGITPLSDGFRLGTDSINTATNIIHYEATE